jgi:hypothetical protein
MPVVGFLGAVSASDYARQVEALRAGLRDLGYAEGKNIVIEYRWAEGNYDRLPDLAGELVRLKVDVLVTHGTPGNRAAKQVTKTIPIVMAVRRARRIGQDADEQVRNTNLKGSTQTAAYTVARLERDGDLALAEEVRSGRKSANKAAIEKGWRRGKRSLSETAQVAVSGMSFSHARGDSPLLKSALCLQPAL